MVVFCRGTHEPASARLHAAYFRFLLPLASDRGSALGAGIRVQGRPIYKNWIFLAIIPEVEWYEEFDWDVVPRLRFGTDMLFEAAAVDRGPR